MARKNEIVIIGAGTFGSLVAQKLSEVSKFTIIVIDKDQEKIDALTKFVDAGYLGNAASAEFLESIGLSNAGVFIVGIGDNVQDSLIVTSLLKKMFPKARVIAKATTQAQKEILLSLGVEDIISPEVAAARRAVEKVINPVLSKGIATSAISEMDGGLSLIRVAATKEMWGKKVMELTLPKGIVINVIYKNKKPTIAVGSTIIQKGNDLMLLGKSKAVYALASELYADEEKEK